MKDERAGDRLLWTVVGASVLLALLSVIATQIISAPPRPDPAMGPVFPRARIPPTTRNIGELLRSMGIGSLTWYACVLTAPLFLWLNRRLPVERRWALSVTVHLVVIAGLVALTASLQHWLSYHDAPYAPSRADFLRAALLTGSLPFITVAAAAQAIEARARAYQRHLEAARVQGQLAEARLEALTAQLQPHFLFNSLQAISTLITHDPPAANRMLASLSDLLREVLRRGDRREVTLEEELRVLKPYLDISRWRYGDRLTVTILADDDARRALVPFFVLQPLVENALHHGISSRAGAGVIVIRATHDTLTLRLSVTDDGAGSDVVESRRGIGLPNTRARLEELYGDRFALQLGRRAEGGFEVCITMPYRKHADEESRA